MSYFDWSIGIEPTLIWSKYSICTNKFSYFLITPDLFVVVGGGANDSLGTLLNLNTNLIRTYKVDFFFKRSRSDLESCSRGQETAYDRLFVIFKRCGASHLESNRLFNTYDRRTRYFFSHCTVTRVTIFWLPIYRSSTLDNFSSTLAIRLWIESLTRTKYFEKVFRIHVRNIYTPIHIYM